VFAILAPDEAIAAFRRRDLLPSFAWEDVWQEEHARAFTVAKLLRMDLLQFVRDELDRAIAEGTAGRGRLVGDARGDRPRNGAGGADHV